MKIDNRQRFLAIVAISGPRAPDRSTVLYSRRWRISGRRASARESPNSGQEIAQGSSLLQRERFIRHRWDDMRSNTLPNNPSLAEQQMLKAFDSWSEQSRVSITSITPQWKHDEDDYMTLECRGCYG